MRRINEERPLTNTERVSRSDEFNGRKNVAFKLSEGERAALERRHAMVGGYKIDIYREAMKLWDKEHGIAPVAEDE